MKKLASILLVVALMATMTISAFAATPAGYNNTDVVADLADTPSFTFTKHYEIAGDTDGLSPAETFKVTFTNYQVNNVYGASPAITVSTMPKINGGAALSLTEATVGTAAADGTVTGTVTLPAYPHVGDYWYTVTETTGTTAGVTYDDNTYYLHVQVINDGAGDFLRLVTLHTNAPDADGNPVELNDTKNDGILNTYSNGNLAITKEVTGNMGDLDRQFEATVTFKYESAVNTIKSTITYDDGTASSIAPADWAKDGNVYTATAVINVKNGETVTFKNIPYGVTYTVVETDYSADGYTHSFAFAASDDDTDTVVAEAAVGTAAEKWAAAKATGSISDATDELTLTNNKATNIDIGVIVENAPYIALILVVLAGGVALIISRRKKALGE